MQELKNEKMEELRKFFATIPNRYVGIVVGTILMPTAEETTKQIWDQCRNRDE